MFVAYWTMKKKAKIPPPQCPSPIPTVSQFSELRSVSYRSIISYSTPTPPSSLNSPAIPPADRSGT